MSRYIGAVMAVLIMLVSLGEGSAQASCAKMVPAEVISGAEAIVNGTVTAVDQRLQQTYYTITPERFYKGEPINPVIVRTDAGRMQASSIDYRMKEGEEHTLYLRVSQGYFTTNACTGSHGGKPTADEASLLGAGVLPPAPSTDRPAQPRMWVPYTAMGIAVAAIGFVLLSVKRRKPD